MLYRIAKLSDIKSIVDLHYAVRKHYDVGFFSKMRKPFIYQYYKIMLNDPYELIICAEDDEKHICGFCSASLNVKEQMNNLRRHKLSLAFSAISSFLLAPNLVFEAFKRWHSTDSKSKERFISIDEEGSRGEYWVWAKEMGNPECAVELLDIERKILKALGIRYHHIEVDTVNKRVLKFHKIRGAKEKDRITLSDGRERIMLYYEL